MIGDGVAALQVELEPGEAMPGTEEQFESALRDATIGRLSLSATVRLDLVLPYAVEVRVEAPGFDAAAADPPASGRPSEFAVIVRNDPDAPVPYLRVAITGVTPAHRLATADDDLALELHPGEYFVELRRGSSWAEVEHPVPLNRVSYFAERQAAGLVATPTPPSAPPRPPAPAPARASPTDESGSLDGSSRAEAPLSRGEGTD